MSSDKFTDAKKIKGSKALEMIMRDVLDGLEDFATQSGYAPEHSGTFEILSVEPDKKSNATGSDIKPRRSRRHKRADIVSFIEKREEILLKLSA